MVRSARVDDKNARGGIEIVGDGCSDECRAVRVMVDVEFGHLSGGDIFGLDYLGLCRKPKQCMGGKGTSRVELGDYKTDGRTEREREQSGIS